MIAICNLSLCREMVIGRIRIFISSGQFFDKIFNDTYHRDCLFTVFLVSSLGSNNSQGEHKSFVVTASNL